MIIIYQTRYILYLCISEKTKIFLLKHYHNLHLFWQINIDYDMLKKKKIILRVISFFNLWLLAFLFRYFDFNIYISRYINFFDNQMWMFIKSWRDIARAMMSYEFPHPVSKTYRYKKVSKIERYRSKNIYFISCNIIIFFTIKIFLFLFYKNLRGFIYKNSVIIHIFSFICFYLILQNFIWICYFIYNR